MGIYCPWNVVYMNANGNNLRVNYTEQIIWLIYIVYVMN